MLNQLFENARLDPQLTILLDDLLVGEIGYEAAVLSCLATELGIML